MALLDAAYIRATVRALLNEYSSVQWTDDQLNKWIQEAAIDISTKTLGYETSDFVFTAANTLEYDEPTGCIKVHACVLVPGCATADDIAYSDDDPIVMDAGTTKEVTVSDGFFTLTWTVTGTGFSWANEETSGRTNTLIASESAEGSGTWTVTDLCGAEAGGDIGVCSDNLSYDDDNPETIARNDDVGITISDGIGPFTWSVSGTGFSFDDETTTAGSNTLRADNSACGVATITVTDACEDLVTGYVRCTTGSWCTCCSAATGGTPNPCGDGTVEVILGIYRARVTCDTSRGGISITCNCLTNCGEGEDGHTITADEVCGVSGCLMIYREMDVWKC